MRRWFRFNAPREMTWAFQQLMASAAKDIHEGRASAARIIDKGPNKAKTHIGWVKRQLLRGEFRRRG